MFEAITPLWVRVVCFSVGVGLFGCILPRLGSDPTMCGEDELLLMFGTGVAAALLFVGVL